MTKKILSLLLLTAAITACNNEEIITGSENGTPLKLNVQTAEINTRAVIETTTLPDASQIGVTLVDDSGTTYDGITYNNLLYTTSGTECTTENTPMLSATTGTLYGYYPYNSDVTDMTQIPVTAGDTDYMYATPVQNLSDGKPTANMQMNHALAVIRLNIVRGTYTGTGAVTSVAVKGDNIATAGTLDAKTGTLSSQTGAGEAITNTTAFTLSAQAKQIDNIIVPVTSSSNDVQGNATPRAAVNATPTFTMTIDGSEYIATADAVSLEQGYIYTYTLTVNGKDVSLSDVQVGDWGYNDSGNPVINAGYKITLAGDLTGIAIHSMTEGTVTRGVVGSGETYLTIKAVPVEENQAVKKATAVDVGNANVIQTINERGVLTITIPLSSLTKDLTITFNGTELLGTIDLTTAENGVYAVAPNGKGVTVEEADESCTAVALIVNDAPTPQRLMIAKADATDGTNTTLYWGYNLSGKDVSGITTIGSGTGYLPKADGTYQSTPNLSTDYTTWTSGGLSDFNGKTNTAAIITAYTEHAVEMNTRDMCSALNTFNSSDAYDDWYVPACGQLALIYLNLTEINEALTAIGGTTYSTSNSYWSSSEYSSYYGWLVYFSNGLVYYDVKYSHCRVRFVRDIE